MAETKIIKLQPGESVTIVCEEVQPAPQPTPTPEPQPEPKPQILSFDDLLAQFNTVLAQRGYKSVVSQMSVRDYLSWAYDFTNRQYESDAWMFRPETYPLLYDYRGSDASDNGTAYNALQAWLMASILAELVPDEGATTNTQTELFKLAYEIGGGRSFPLYSGKAFKADPYAMREVASVMYAVCRGDSDISAQIDKYRSELGGKPINASSWDGLGYKNTILTDAQGRRGYRMDYLGYCVNTELFIPDAPGPRVLTTTVCDLPMPFEQGQDPIMFNISTGNYIMDEQINDFFVKNYDMMSQTPLSVWNSYSRDKQNRMINVGAIPPCTFIYMFGRKNIRFDGIKHKAYGTNPAYDYYCFSEVSEVTGLALDGPFSDLQGIYRYNIMGDREKCLDTVATIFDCFRFPTEDPNYGRCRPGCKVSRTVQSLNPTPGAPENEVYNVDLCVMVSDDEAGKTKRQGQDGFAADSPRSYVSGHSAQIWGLALMLTQMHSDHCATWICKAYEYSVNRSVGRFHWNSDCVYGRLFGAIALPIVNAMKGLNIDPIRNYVLNPQPIPTGNWEANIIIKNMTGSPIKSTGEIRLYVDNHIGINVYLPNARPDAGALYTFNVGENDFVNMGIHCVGNGFTLDDSYDGKAINEERIYDYRHYNNKDWTPAGMITLDMSDARCSSFIWKSGATYVLKITNK